MKLKIKRAAVLKAKLKKAEETGEYLNRVSEQYRYYHTTKGIYASRIFGLCFYRPNEIKK